jgi:hypothetical protein
MDLICHNKSHHDLIELIDQNLCYDQDEIGRIVKKFFMENEDALHGKAPTFEEHTPSFMSCHGQCMEGRDDSSEMCSRC